MKNYAISVFIPVYNFDPKSLIKNISKLQSFISKNYKKYEIIIVDDNSNEQTKEAITKAKKIKNIRSLTFENGPSRRENLAVSFSESKYEIICFMDVDLSTEINYLLELTDKINEGNDVAIGSRYKGIQPKREMYRLLISKAYNGTFQFLFNSKVKDHNCGFKAFRKESILKIIEKLGYDNTKKRGWFWDVEMLIVAQKNKYKIAEIPVKWIRDENSTFSWKRELKIIPYMISVWYKLNFLSKIIKRGL
jgi:hypothetical protein